ncbi:cysteine desulfurase family protein [Nocardia jiangsuensis]|uniref:cysteine desulfurase n=1 Tax=Nocardia jiangsuensis TaxID=1691563 RepID=A0ABV8DNM4_9NOCA
MDPYLTVDRPLGVTYLDYNATAPLRAEALAAMVQVLETVGNASSQHAYGVEAANHVATARRRVADLLGCSAGELIFTAGATEANNLALHATYRGRRIVVGASEHPAILETAHACAPGNVVVAPVSRDGAVDTVAAAAALATGDVDVVSIMAANNETGVLSDLSAIVELAHAAGAVVHTDATQLVGKLPIDLGELDVDLLSLSAHKFGGPQGVGALFVRRSLRLAPRPLLHGGGHERGWRAGTANVAGIVGMGAAALEAKARCSLEAEHSRQLRDRLEKSLLAAVPGSSVNGSTRPRLPGVTSMTFADTPADAVLAAMPTVAASDGSACHSGALGPSHVLTAMGLSRTEAESTIRFSLGYATTEADVDHVIQAVPAAVAHVRNALRPVVKMSSRVNESRSILPMSNTSTDR